MQILDSALNSTINEKWFGFLQAGHVYLSASHHFFSAGIEPHIHLLAALFPSTQPVPNFCVARAEHPLSQPGERPDFFKHPPQVRYVKTIIFQPHNCSSNQFLRGVQPKGVLGVIKELCAYFQPRQVSGGATVAELPRSLSLVLAARGR